MGRGLAVAAVRSLSEGRPRAVLPRRRRAWSGLQPPGAGRQGHLCGLHGSGGVPRVRTAGAGTARDLGWAVYGGARSHPDRGSRRSSVCLTGRQQSRRRRPLPSPAHPARCGHRGHTSVDCARRVFGRALLASPANSPRSGWSVRAAWSAATPAVASRAAGVRRTPPEPHGPYWQWSANINGRTVTRRLTERQAALDREWIANDRRQLRRLITGLRQAAEGAIELMLQADESRWEHPIRKRPEASQAWVALVDRDRRTRTTLGRSAATPPLTPCRGSGSTTLPGSAGSALPPRAPRR